MLKKIKEQQVNLICLFQPLQKLKNKVQGGRGIVQWAGACLAH